MFALIITEHYGICASCGHSSNLLLPLLNGNRSGCSAAEQLNTVWGFIVCKASVLPPFVSAAAITSNMQGALDKELLFNASSCWLTSFHVVDVGKTLSVGTVKWSLAVCWLLQWDWGGAAVTETNLTSANSSSPPGSRFAVVYLALCRWSGELKHGFASRCHCVHYKT